ncbi:branched-chain amino acid ABC transporter permease [Dermatophilaceae bacterium Sec6.4]
MLSGLLTGGLLGLAAAGFTLLWRITGLLNLAQGAMILLGAYVAWFVAVPLGAGLVAAVLVAILCGLALGYVVQRFLLNLLVGGPSYLAVLAAYGVGLAIDEALALLFTDNYRTIPSVLADTDLALGPLRVLWADALALAVSVLGVVILGLVLTRTRLGLGLRAISMDRDAGRLIGLPAATLFARAAALSGAAAAAAGSVIAIGSPFTATQGNHLLVLVSTAAVIGRLGNLWGAFAGGMALGGLQSLVTLYAPLQLTDVVALLVLLGLLAIRPVRAPMMVRGRSQHQARG